MKWYAAGARTPRRRHRASLPPRGLQSVQIPQDGCHIATWTPKALEIIAGGLFLEVLGRCRNFGLQARATAKIIEDSFNSWLLCGRLRIAIL